MMAINSSRIHRESTGVGLNGGVCQDGGVEPPQHPPAKRGVSGWRPRPLHHHAIHDQWESSGLLEEKQGIVGDRAIQRSGSCECSIFKV